LENLGSVNWEIGSLWGVEADVAYSQWPFENKHVVEILNTLERQKLLFNLTLQSDHIALSQAIRSDIRDLN
jgi:hypothetical protein